MFVCHVLGIEARSELYLRFDSPGTEIWDFTGKKRISWVLWVACPLVDFTGLAQIQPISRACDTVKKEGPWGNLIPSNILKKVLVSLAASINNKRVGYRYIVDIIPQIFTADLYR